MPCPPTAAGPIRQGEGTGAMRKPAVFYSLPAALQNLFFMNIGVK
jgi:hypothetical protein